MKTTSAAQYFLLAMALYPELQKKAQAQLDSVVGPNRLPEYEDLEQMPFIHALTMETMRWLPVLPFSIPHVVMEDDEYKGYHIPKGAVIVPVGRHLSYTVLPVLTLLYRMSGTLRHFIGSHAGLIL